MRILTLPFRLVATLVKLVLTVVKVLVLAITIPIRLVVKLVVRIVRLAADLTFGLWRAAMFLIRTVLKIVFFPLRIVGIGRKRKAPAVDAPAIAEAA